MTTSALTRVRLRNARALFAAAVTLAAEGVRTGCKRGTSQGARNRLRRALCTIAERLAVSDVELEPIIAEVRCGHRRGRWTREFTPMTLAAAKPPDTALVEREGVRLSARVAREGRR
jgi:hypothetical protein